MPGIHENDDRAWIHAWIEGHSGGYGDVENIYMDIAAVINTVWE